MVPFGVNSTEMTVTELLSECNGSSYCHTPDNGSCYYSVEGEPWSYGYTVTFGCFGYQEYLHQCPWDNNKDLFCCYFNDCNGMAGEQLHKHI